MKFDDMDIEVISAGQLWIDGGNMFGVVPKTLWAEHTAPDEENRVELNTNCLLVRCGSQIGVVDTGYGSKASVAQRQRFRLQAGHVLISNLAKRGIEPGQVAS